MTVRYSRHQRTANPPWEDDQSNDLFEQVITETRYVPSAPRDMFRTRSYLGATNQIMEALLAYLEILREYADAIGAAKVSKALSRKVASLDDAFSMYKSLDAISNEYWLTPTLKRSALDVLINFRQIEDASQWAADQTSREIPLTEHSLRGDSLVRRIAGAISVGLKQIELATKSGSNTPGLGDRGLGPESYFKKLKI